MASEVDWEVTDVIICGCGPTGAALSGYLGKLEVNNVVLEREPDITTDPRGIALDEDGIRILQGVGVYDHVFKEIGTCMHQFQFISGTKPNLSSKPFMLMDYATTEGGTGHVGFICQRQPILEKYLRQAMASTGHSQLRSESTVTEISEDDDWVYCLYSDARGTSRKIKAKFLVGADGKTGFTRKRYLEPHGIVLERAHNYSYEETWVALNWKISLPTKETHPDFPLWRKGYSPQDVYDAFFPTNFRFLCNPDRPAVCGRFGLMSDRLWRFEFLVKQGENGDEMASQKMIRKVVFPYIRHPGSRYGLQQDLNYPEDCIEVLRCRPFSFSARSCNRWSRNRVILCGDAAHVFPPFGGQGIASGFRDAISLAWRLAIGISLRSSHNDRIEPLLKAWYSERKQQLEKSLATTIENGQFVTARNPLKILWRNWYLWLLQLFPWTRHQLHLGNRREGMIRYAHQEGMPFVEGLQGGRCLPQVYCVELSSTNPEVFFTDDVIWSHKSKGLFRLLILLESVDEVDDALHTIQPILSRFGSLLQLEQATILIEDTMSSAEKSKLASNMDMCIYRTATAEEFAASKLCMGRPTPKGYNPSRLGKEMNHSRFIILRPDRFVFAACNDPLKLESAMTELAFLFPDMA